VLLGCGNGRWQGRREQEQEVGRGSRGKKLKPEKKKEKKKKFHVRMERKRLITHMRNYIMRTEYVMAMERQG